MKTLFYKLAYYFLRLFYEKKWITGKWFEKYKIGFLWAFKSIPHRIFHHDRPWPYGKNVTILSAENLEIDPSSLGVLQSEVYIQNKHSKVHIGKNCCIASHTGLITEQHDFYDLDKHTEAMDIIISDNCWIGMNAVVMPGVILGPRTIVGANSVVTKSFPDGNVVLAGAPAKIIRQL